MLLRSREGFFDDAANGDCSRRWLGVENGEAHGFRQGEARVRAGSKRCLRFRELSRRQLEHRFSRAGFEVNNRPWLNVGGNTAIALDRLLSYASIYSRSVTYSMA